MGEGPIPWTAVVEYGILHRMDEDTYSEFEEIIFALDRVYMKWRADSQKEEK